MSRTLRVAHLSDSHFDASADLEDVEDTHEEILSWCDDECVGLIVHAGDWFDRESTPIERLAVARWLRRAAELAPVVGVRGNHDAPKDLEIFGRVLEPVAGRYPIHIFEQAGSGLVVAGALVLPWPWVDKAHVAAGLDAGTEQNTSRLATIDAARSLLSALAFTSSQHPDLPKIMVAHVMVQASEVANGQVLMGHGVELAPADLRLSCATYIACGHVHKHQAWHEGAGLAPVVYSGSPSRHDHGEPEDKGFVLVEFDGPRLVSWRFQPLQARRLYHVEIDAEDPEQLRALEERRFGSLIDERLCSGARVRIRYKARPETLPLIDAEGLWAAACDAGAFEVKVERQAVPVSVVRAAAASVSAELTLAGKVRSYLEARGTDLSRWEPISEKLAALEAEP